MIRTEQDAPAEGHNSAVNAAHLRAFVERVETIRSSQADLAEDLKDLYSEVRSVGYDAKIVKEIVKIRAQDRDKRREHDEILSIYLVALGME